MPVVHHRPSEWLTPNRGMRQLPICAVESRIRFRLSPRCARPAADNPEEQEHGPDGLHGDERPDLTDAVRPRGQDQEEPAENTGDGNCGLEQVGLFPCSPEQSGEEVDGKIEHEEDGKQAHQMHRGSQDRSAARAPDFFQTNPSTDDFQLILSAS